MAIVVKCEVFKCKKNDKGYCTAEKIEISEDGLCKSLVEGRRTVPEVCWTCKHLDINIDTMEFFCTKGHKPDDVFTTGCPDYEPFYEEYTPEVEE